MSNSSPINLRSSSKRQRTSTLAFTPPSPDEHGGEQTPVSVTGGEDRPRVQKVFTEEEEIQLLNSIVNISNSSSSPVLKIDSPIFNRIDRSLGDKFTRIQLNKKLRRLRLKYHKLAKTKSGIKTPHHRQVYEIGRVLWGKNRNASNNLSVTVAEENGNGCADEIEEDGEEEIEADYEEKVEEKIGGVDLTKYPVVVEEFEKSEQGNGMWREYLKDLEESKVRKINDKLVMLRYEEATIMAKKAKLLQELTMMILGSVCSSGNASV